MDESSSNSNKEPEDFDYFFDERTKKYCCNVCFYKSKLKYKIKSHFCDSTFIRPTDLKNHSVEMPFRCKIWTLRFLKMKI